MGCINVGDENENVTRLITDLSIDCKSTGYKYWIIFGSSTILFLSSVIFPLYIIINLFYAKKKKAFKEKKIIA